MHAHFSTLPGVAVQGALRVDEAILELQLYMHFFLRCSHISCLLLQWTKKHYNIVGSPVIWGITASGTSAIKYDFPKIFQNGPIAYPNIEEGLFSWTIMHEWH